MNDALRLLAYLPRWAVDHASDWLGYYGRGTFDTKYLSQHALAFGCDAYGGAPYVMWGIEGRPRLLDLKRYRGCPAGSTLWLRIEDLARFNREVLPSIEAPFVLITGESDYCVPSDFRADADATWASGKVKRWFATNYDGELPEGVITRLPLGMNYRKKHDLHWVDGKLLRRERYAVAEQERRWERLRDEAPPSSRRKLLALGDFWLNNSSAARRYGESRDDIRRTLDGNRAVSFPPRIVEHAELMRAYGEHAFVISPHGRGLDCYRTWEALFMGCIVIVKRSPLDPMYRDLPVVIVEDWREVTEASLAAWLDRYGDRFDRAPLRRCLSMAHWHDRLRT